MTSEAQCHVTKRQDRILIDAIISCVSYEGRPLSDLLSSPLSPFTTRIDPARSHASLCTRTYSRWNPQAGRCLLGGGRVVRDLTQLYLNTLCLQVGAPSFHPCAGSRPRSAERCPRLATFKMRASAAPRPSHTWWREQCATPSLPRRARQLCPLLPCSPASPVASA